MLAENITHRHNNTTPRKDAKRRIPHHYRPPTVREAVIRNMIDSVIVAIPPAESKSRNVKFEASYRPNLISFSKSRHEFLPTDAFHSLLNKLPIKSILNLSATCKSLADSFSDHVKAEEFDERITFQKRKIEEFRYTRKKTKKVFAHLISAISKDFSLDSAFCLIHEAARKIAKICDGRFVDIDLSSRSWDEIGIILCALVNGLNRCKGVEYLNIKLCFDFRNNKKEADHATHVRSQIDQCTTTVNKIRFDLSVQADFPESSDAMGTVLKCLGENSETNITKINAHAWGKSGIISLGELLREQKNIEILNLHANESLFRHDGHYYLKSLRRPDIWRDILGKGRHPSLKYFLLTGFGNYPADAWLEDFMTILDTADGLVGLSLKQSAILSRHAVWLAKKIETSRSIKIVNISGNHIGRKGISALQRVVSQTGIKIKASLENMGDPDSETYQIRRDPQSQRNRAIAKPFIDAKNKLLNPDPTLPEYSASVYVNVRDVWLEKVPEKQKPETLPVLSTESSSTD